MVTFNTNGNFTCKDDNGGDRMVRNIKKRKF